MDGLAFGGDNTGAGEESHFDQEGNNDPDKLDMNEGDMDMRQSVLVGHGFKANANVKYEDFQLKMLLGRGTFGKVFLAELKKDKKLYAIKAIRKDVLIEYNQV